MSYVSLHRRQIVTPKAHPNLDFPLWMMVSQPVYYQVIISPGKRIIVCAHNQ